MLSKFFIDRPIFATVLSVVITLMGAVSLVYLPIAQYPRITPPSVQVAITYPGASAQVVADTVAAPLEQAVTGVPNMLYMSSQMGNDGTYSLSVTFDVSVDLNTALVMVQNRVTTAMPLLPTPVQNQGITIRKKTPDILNMVNFISDVRVTMMDGTEHQGRVKDEDESSITMAIRNRRSEHHNQTITLAKDQVKARESIHSDIYLSNYLLINVKDEILRVDGVSDVSIMGERDYSIRVWMDPQKLASRNMTAVDVQNAINDQNVQAAPGQIGSPPISVEQPFQLTLHTLGRLTLPEQFENIIVKVGGGKRPARTSVSPATTAAAGDTSTVAPMAPGTSSGATMGTLSSLGGANTGGGGDSDSGTTSGGASIMMASNIGTSGATAAGGVSKGGAGVGSGASPTGTMSSGMKLAKSAPAPKKVKRNTVVRKVVPAFTGPTPPSIPVVRLKDVARVDMGALNYNMSCSFDGGPAVGLAIYQLPGTNALDVADRIRERMRDLKKRFPEGLDYIIAYDTAPFIRESIAEVFNTLRDAVILVAIVVLLFLQDWRAMILPMIDVPVSLIGTFAVMAAMGYSLNNISLFGLVLAIGIVVDDAIVVLENIERQMAKGLDTRTATIKAMEEISGPIMAITLVLCAVFVPCAFITGITGRFFTQFAVTIAASTIISAINALTMTPSRALMIFKTQEGHAHKAEALPWWIFGLFGAVTATYLPKMLAGHFGIELPAEADDFVDEAPLPAWQTWGLSALYFAPGMLIGMGFGWLCIRPINAVLGWIFRGFNRGFDWMTAGYGKVVGLSLRLSVLALLVYGGLLVATYYLAVYSPTGFVPQQDQGRLIVSVSLPDSSSLSRTENVVRQVEKITRGVDGVAHTIGLCGISFVEQANAPNFGSLLVILKPFEQRQQRHQRADAIMAILRKKWARQVTDAKVVVLGAAPIPGLSVAGGFKVMVENRGGLELSALQEQTDRLVRKLQSAEYKITGNSLATLHNFGVPEELLDRLSAMHDQSYEKEAFLEELNQYLGKSDRDRYKDKFLKATMVPRIGLKDVSTQFRSNTPQVFMDIDRTKAASLGVSLDQLNQSLENFLGSLYVNSFNEYGRYWQVTIQADAEFRSKMSQVNLLQVRNSKGQMVPLGSLVTMKEIAGPIFIRRYNLYTAGPITGGLLPGVSSGEVIDSVNRISEETLPLSMKADWTELMFMQIKEGNTSGIVFGLAVVCVFLALAALYESWTLPLAVILVVPLCMLCCLIGVLVRSTSVNIFVQIGLVVLVGLACKNAILVVEFARELHTQGKSVFAATLEASRLRLRPILMTSFAFILGVVPLCIASGAGAEMRQSLGTAVFSGMLGVTLFGIFFTPVFFYVIGGVGEAKLFEGALVQWSVSLMIGLVLGSASGYLLAKLGVVPMMWAMIVGGVAGVLAVIAVRGLHHKLRGN